MNHSRQVSIIQKLDSTVFNNNPDPPKGYDAQKLLLRPFRVATPEIQLILKEDVSRLMDCKNHATTLPIQIFFAASLTGFCTID